MGATPAADDSLLNVSGASTEAIVGATPAAPPLDVPYAGFPGNIAFIVAAGMTASGASRAVKWADTSNLTDYFCACVSCRNPSQPPKVPASYQIQHFALTRALDGAGHCTPCPPFLTAENIREEKKREARLERLWADEGDRPLPVSDGYY